MTYIRRRWTQFVVVRFLSPCTFVSGYERFGVTSCLCLKTYALKTETVFCFTHCLPVSSTIWACQKNMN